MRVLASLPGGRRSARLAAVALAGLAALSACGGGGGVKSVSGSAQGTAPTGPPPSGYSAWPEAQHDARHSSESSVQGPQGGRLRWKAALGGPATEGPVIGPTGTIYEASDAGVLHAINPLTGAIRWSFNGGGPLVGADLSTSSAVLPDGTVVWPGSNDTVFGVSSSGTLLWKVKVSGSPLSPIIANSKDIYVMTASGSLSAIAISAHSAAARWTIPLGATSFGSPVIRPDGVVETTVDNTLVAVQDNGSSAKVLWRYTLTKSDEVSPTVTPANVTILGTNDGYEFAISPTGSVNWKFQINTYSYSSPGVSSAGSAYFGDNHGNLSIVNVKSGAPVRVDHAPVGQIWTAPVIDRSGDVYFGTNSGNVYGFDAAGHQLFNVATGALAASYPALSSDGDLLIASHSGYLYSIGR